MVFRKFFLLFLQKTLYMIRKIVFLAFFIVSFFAKAQYLGIKAGYNYGSLQGESTQNVSIKRGHGFYAGLTLDVPFSKIFSVLSEAQFSRISSKISGNAVGEAELTLNYLSIPAMAKLHIYRGLYINVGPQLSFLLDNHDFEFKQSILSIPVEDKAIATVDFSLVAGAMYKSQSGIFFEMRVSKGLTNVFDTSNETLKRVPFSKDYDYKNLVISAGIGYIF